MSSMVRIDAQNVHQDDLVAYQIAEASCRQMRDRLIVHWKDTIHAFLQQPGLGNPRLLHSVIDSMDEFLRRSKS